MYLDSKLNCSGNNSNVNGASDTELTSMIDPNKFHEFLRIQALSTLTEVERYYTENVASLRNQFGILLFLYSVISTKVSSKLVILIFLNLFIVLMQGLEVVKLESDTTEPLIDETYGYGSQSLINLMITGKAVTYVWDHEQDVGGLSKMIIMLMFLLKIVEIV